ncbi:hypothetical protein [Thermotoga sp. KOL6]|uniref:hypothetical protein n=1 Tax=Thermotoga sp. KOL6 TaxID=126741 RepID=UPI00004EA940|nr:hypothetical protein [Thermotoga sp. KOL6]PLV58768.1 hypothetical protein AS005_07785 [Thermotoga sp. KOL6]CAI44387.1 hypothetical protein [Thermotoga sp. KOL6]
MAEKLPIKTVMAILVENRKETAEKVQKILTAWGCLIKTRLGLHDGVLDNCSEAGLIVLELVGSPEQHRELCDKLNKLPGVKADYMELSFDEK